MVNIIKTEESAVIKNTQVPVFSVNGIKFVRYPGDPQYSIASVWADKSDPYEGLEVVGYPLNDSNELEGTILFVDYDTQQELSILEPRDITRVLYKRPEIDKHPAQAFGLKVVSYNIEVGNKPLSLDILFGDESLENSSHERAMAAVIRLPHESEWEPQFRARNPKTKLPKDVLANFVRISSIVWEEADSLEGIRDSKDIEGISNFIEIYEKKINSIFRGW